jgi:hypothetical protein
MDTISCTEFFSFIILLRIAVTIIMFDSLLVHGFHAVSLDETFTATAYCQNG